MSSNTTISNSNTTASMNSEACWRGPRSQYDVIIIPNYIMTYICWWLFEQQWYNLHNLWSAATSGSFVVEFSFLISMFISVSIIYWFWILFQEVFLSTKLNDSFTITNIYRVIVLLGQHILVALVRVELASFKVISS